MEKNPINLLLDTNVIVSAYTHEGKPAEILQLILEEECDGCISNPLLTEVLEILIKKFQFRQEKVTEVETEIRDIFSICYPTQEIIVVRDPDDNKVLEAAVEGGCEYVITGDKDLLSLKKFRTIHIVTPQEFLKMYGKSFSG